MSDNNEDKTDKLFQQGAERYDFTYDPAAWKQMEALLKQDRRRRLLRWWSFSILLLLLIVGSASLWLQPEKPFQSTQADLVSDTNDKALPNTTKDINPQSGSVSKNTEFQASPDPILLEENKKLSSVKEIMNETSNAEIKKASTAKREEQNLTTITNRDEKPLNPIADVNSTNKIAAAFTIEPSLSVPSIPKLTFKVDGLPPPLIDIPSPVAPLKKPLISVASNGLVISASFGNIVGGGGDQNFSRGKNRFGLQLEYRALKKIGLKTGIHYGKLDYCVGPGDYKAADGFWTDGIAANLVQASCKVLDIPLLLSYYPSGNQESGLYFSAGLNSYLFLQEDFQFSYETTVPNQKLSWQEINTNRHLFGFGQVSIGWQNYFGKRTGFQLEAYAQLPLTGIGHGQVNLINAGVSASFLLDFRKK